MLAVSSVWCYGCVRFCSVFYSYGRVYTTDPYHAALTPATAAAYGVGAMVNSLLSTDTWDIFSIF